MLKFIPNVFLLTLMPVAAMAQVARVPEPGTMALLAGAVAAVVIVGRIQKKK